MPKFELALLLAALALAGVFGQWNRPLEQTLRLLGIELPPDFDERERRRLLRLYRVSLAFAVFIVFLPVVVFFNPRLFSSAIWVYVALGVAPRIAFRLWAWRKLRYLKPGPLPMRGAAMFFQIRPLGQLISWPAEMAMVVLLAAIWTAVLRINPRIWDLSLLVSWCILGLLPGEIIFVKASWPAPPERPEDYHRWYDASRSEIVQAINRWRWFMLAMLGGIVAMKSWPAVLDPDWARPSLFAGVLGGLYWQSRMLMHASNRVQEAGRGLLRVGAWTGPFGPVRPSFPGWKTWLTAYVAGFVVIIGLIERFAD